MIVQSCVLCPVDFSEASRGALRYAGAIAEHVGARLMLLAVNDPLLQEAGELAGVTHLKEDTVEALGTFVHETFAHRATPVPNIRMEVTTGKPAPEILRASQEHGCDLIVMSSHGLTGFRKMFFGSTTERVLRETRVPVLVTPANDTGPAAPAEVRHVVRRILAPVDLTAATPQQVQSARALAEALGAALMLLHVVEPVRGATAAVPWLPGVDAERRSRAEQDLNRALEAIPADLKAEPLIAYGEPAEEIAKVAADRDAGLIVIGLHSSPLLGPRMGSVTYRVLCLAHRLVLALPPQPVTAEGGGRTVEEVRQNRPPVGA